MIHPFKTMKEQNCEQWVTGFIEDIWNSNRIEMLSKYLHEDFIDYSLPCGLQNAKGLSAYLMELKKNICHKTKIQKLTVMQDLVVVDLKILLSPLADPEDIELCNKAGETMSGYRMFKMLGNQIIAHWEFLEHSVCN